MHLKNVYNRTVPGYSWKSSQELMEYGLSEYQSILPTHIQNSKPQLDALSRRLISGQSFETLLNAIGEKFKAPDFTLYMIK